MASEEAPIQHMSSKRTVVQQMRDAGGNESTCNLLMRRPEGTQAEISLKLPLDRIVGFIEETRMLEWN